jgi:hypothetical protein
MIPRRGLAETIPLHIYIFIELDDSAGVLRRAKIYVLVILVVSVLYNLPRCWEVSPTSTPSTIILYGC